MSQIDTILIDILALAPQDRLQLVDKILASLHPKNSGVDRLWETESQERITALNEGRVPTVDENDLFEKYNA